MIPLILSAVALGTAAFGVGAGVVGVADMNEAKEIGERAQKRYEYAVSKLKADREATDKLAREYGQLQLDVKCVQLDGSFPSLSELVSVLLKAIYSF